MGEDKFSEFQPILFGQIIFHKDYITILLGHKKVVLKSIIRENRELFIELFSLCDGVNKIKDILNKLQSLGCSVNKVKDILKTLIEQKILVDSREIYLHFHHFCNNPTPYYYVLTKDQVKLILSGVEEFDYKGESLNLQLPKNSEFCELLAQRRSIREFNKEKIISFQTFSELLYSAYGMSTKASLGNSAVVKRVVPSGGALYPLHIFCIVWGKIEKVPGGIYYFLKKENTIRRIKDISPQEVSGFIAENENMIENASCLLVIVCNFKRITQKYANRGYLLALLEAGHVAQNVYLYCTEQKLAAVEISSFKDAELAKFLGLNYPEVSPLISILIGSRI
jgi:SagB-type dehydrogenase family enzyme